jgi:dihydroxy-acid dehydratase
VERDHPLQPDAVRLAKATSRRGVSQAGGYPLEFGTISVSDGISMGHEGMHFSLVSREIIATRSRRSSSPSASTGSVLLAGCDKSLPGHADGRRPARPVASAMIYNGSTMPGEHNGEATDITSVFEGRRGLCAGRHHPEELDEIERTACPGEGACGRHVHRQHDELDRRGPRHVDPRVGVAAGHRRSRDEGRPPSR